MIDVASQACYRYSSRENWKTGAELNSSGSCAAVALSENAITAVSLPLVSRPGARREFGGVYTRGGKLARRVTYCPHTFPAKGTARFR